MIVCVYTHHCVLQTACVEIGRLLFPLKKFFLYFFDVAVIRNTKRIYSNNALVGVFSVPIAQHLQSPVPPAFGAPFDTFAREYGEINFLSFLFLSKHRTLTPHIRTVQNDAHPLYFFYSVNH